MVKKKECLNPNNALDTIPSKEKKGGLKIKLVAPNNYSKGKDALQSFSSPSFVFWMSDIKAT